ncbi:MAG: oligosaccharide flippase family protein [Woeseiaceae bacterium]
MRRVLEAFVFRGFGFLLLFLMHLSIGRILGPDGYGIFNFGFMVASLLVIFASLGWPTAIVRLFAEYGASKEWGLLIGASKRSIHTVLFVSLCFSLLLTLIARHSFFNTEQQIGLQFAALLIPVLALIGLIRKGFIAFERTNTSIVLEDILIPALFIVLLFALNLSGVVEITIAYLTTAIVALLVSLFVFRSVFRKQIPRAPAEYKTKYWTGLGAAMVLGGIGQIVINRLDVMMLGVMVEMDSVGIYVASNRLALVATMPLIAVHTVVASKMAKAYYGNDLDEFRQLLYRSATWSALGALPIVIALVLSPGLFLNLFGSGYESGISLLRILTVAQFVNALTGSANFALLVTGRERQYAAMTGLIAALNVVGNLIAIPIAGALGAAIVSAVCVVILNLWLMRIALAIK